MATVFMLAKVLEYVENEMTLGRRERSSRWSSLLRLS